jgi:hypothetical protein
VTYYSSLLAPGVCNTHHIRHSHRNYWYCVETTRELPHDPGSFAIFTTPDALQICRGPWIHH